MYKGGAAGNNPQSQNKGTPSSQIIQSYEHYAYGHGDLRGPNYRHLNLNKPDQLRLYPKSQLCNLMFLQGHECIFGPFCLFAHSIADVDDRYTDIELQKKAVVPHSQKRLFMDLGIWPSICILQFFTQEEIIETMRRINKQALFLCKRAYAPKRVQLHKVNLGTVKFFERAEEIKIIKDSLPFFQTYRESFFLEILNHYKNVRRITINLNFLFEDDKKDRLIEMLCLMHQNEPLKESIKVFSIEDAVISERNIESLFKSNIMQNIQYLKLPRNSLGNKGIERLFKAAAVFKMGRIKKLDISSNMITGEEGAQIIANGTGFPNLESLDIRNNKLGIDGFKKLVQTENYPQLIGLKVDMNRLEDTGAQQLSQICNLTNLQVLKLRQNQIEAKGAQFIAQSYSVRQLLTLDLSSNQIGDEGFKQLTINTYLSNLHKLYVNNCDLTEKAAQYLKQSRFLGKLRLLSIGKNKLKNEGTQYLADAPNLDQLQELYLNDNEIKEDGANAIQSSAFLKNLTHLDLNQNSIGENGAHILSISGNLMFLKYLNLNHNNIGENGCKCIADSDSFPLLQDLVIYTGNGIQAKAKAYIFRSQKLRSLSHVS